MVFFFGSFTKKTLWRVNLMQTMSNPFILLTQMQARKKRNGWCFSLLHFFVTLLWEWITRLDCSSLFLIISFFIVSFCVFVWVFLYVHICWDDDDSWFSGIAFLDDFLGLIFLDDDDDWNHLTKTPYTTARKGKEEKLFLTHFCVLLMLLESELHFIVFAPGFSLCSIVNYTSGFVMEIESTKQNKTNNNNNPLSYYFLKNLHQTCELRVFCILIQN